MTDQAKSVKGNWDIVLTDTNAKKLISLHIISFSKIQLVVYYQCCVLTG